MLATNVATTRIPCIDGFGRMRSVGVWAAPMRGKVVLVAPPAETALLTPAQARELRDRLDELANEVEADEHRLASAQAQPDTASV
jgi:hypothetical protein